MKRNKATAVLLGLLFLAASAPAGAQDGGAGETAARPIAARTLAAQTLASQPAAPIPYAQLAPKPTQPKPADRTPSPAVPKPASGFPPSGVRLAPGQPIPPAELSAFVDGFVRAAMARDHIAGVTVSVVQNGQVVLKRGYGFADLSPVRPVDPDRTLFRIGSISKTFTWITVMKAVEAGRMRLDRPINLYLPLRLRIPDQGYAQPILVANLMDHSPGFEDRALGQLFEDRFANVRPLDVFLRQARPKRVRPPGVVSSYSNYGAALAGEAAAWVSGKPYESLVEDQILKPAGLAHTTFREPHPVKPGYPAPMPPALAGDISRGFAWRGASFRPQPYEYMEQIAPAGAASSTAGDMARYMLLLLGNGQLNGVTIFGPATANAFRTPMRATPPGINGWAHGFVVESLPGGHRGFGHDGGTLDFFSDMVVVPDLDLGLFISVNTESGAPLSQSFAHALVRQFYAGPPAAPRRGSAALRDASDVFSGYYLTTRRPYSGLEAFVRLLFQSGVKASVTPDGRLLLAGFGGVSAYVPDGPLSDGRFLSAEGDSPIVFQVRDGRAVSILPTGGSELYERASVWKTPSTLGLFAALTAAAAALTLLGAALRNRRELRQSTTQLRAGLIQNIQAGLWLTDFLLFGLWASRALGDLTWVMYTWPGVLVILASACALVASILTVPTLIALPSVWSGGRRVDSWSGLRKASFTVSVLIYLAFSLMLASWGALLPWTG